MISPQVSWIHLNIDKKSCHRQLFFIQPSISYLCSVKRKILILVLVLVILVLLIAMPIFYWGKITSFWHNPDHFWKLFLDATQLPAFLTISTLTGVIMCLLMIGIDMMALGWKGSGLRRLVVKPSGSAKVDWWSFVLSVTRIYDALHFVITFGIFYFIASIFVRYFNINLGGYIENVYLQFAFIFIVTDLKVYVGHRFMHLRPLWELHAYHHSAEEFNLITTNRGHFLETSVHYLFTGLFFALFGAPLYNIFILGLIRESYQYLLHSDVNWKLGFVGKYILISPAAHRLHHSIDEKDYNKNYGTFFIWWDYLFGTYAAPEGEYKLGIANNPYNEVGYFKGQWIGFKRFLGKR